MSTATVLRGAALDAAGQAPASTVAPDPGDRYGPVDPR
jgi:hypothetical protein